MLTGLQIGRAIAAVMVVLCHASLGTLQFYGIAFNNFWSFGHIGIDFFFVLSGFIIYWVHADNDLNAGSARSYTVKRLSRIYPPYLPVSIGLLVAYTFVPSLSVSDVNREIGVLTSLFLIPTAKAPALTVAWTLMHEMLFYCSFLLLYAFGKKVLLYFYLAWAAAMVFFHAAGQDMLYVRFLLNPHNLQFLFGVGCAMLVKRQMVSPISFVPGAILLLIYVGTRELERFDLDFIWQKAYLGLAFAMIIIGLCSVEKRLSYPRFLVFLGAASYSIYLVHNPAISIANRLVPMVFSPQLVSAEVIWLVVVAVSILASVAYFIIVERPLHRLLRRKLS